MKIFLLLLLVSVSSYAQDFCSRTKDNIREALMQPSGRMAFKNGGGLFNGGVCWWHSRMQRASAYLVRFDPGAPTPSAYEAKRLVARIRNLNEVVTIPGFADFESFSRVHKNIVQKTLEAWQRRDGFINQQWIRSISGRSSLHPKTMEKKMRSIYDIYLASPVPVWLMAQIKGISAHAFLLLDMKETPTGYILKVIDSNKPEAVREITYNYGDKNHQIPGTNYKFVLYVGFQKDFRKMALAIKDHCSNKETNLMFDMDAVPRGDIEVE